MIQTQTILKVADNSGAKTVKCIGFCGVTVKQKAQIGDCIIVSVRSLTPRSTSFQKGSTASRATSQRKQGGSTKSIIKKGQIFKALIIRTKKGIFAGTRKYSPQSVRGITFDSNDVVLINTQGNLVGSRIFGPITRELRAKDWRSILSYSDRVL